VAAVWNYPTLAAAAPNNPVLRDEVVFKEDAVLPEFAKSRNLPCVVLEQGDATVRVNISPFRGVNDLREIDRNLIAEIRIGDRSDIALAELRKKAVIPERSAQAAYYRALLDNDLKAFFEAHGASPSAEAAREMEEALKIELAMVEAGWQRIGQQWFAPDQSDELERKLALEAILQAIEDLQKDLQAGKVDGLPALVQQIQKHSRYEYYPELIEGLKIVTMASWADMPTAVKSVLRTPVEPLQLAVRHVRTSEAKLTDISNLEQYPAKILQRVLMDLAEAARLFPKLESLESLLVKRFGLFEQFLYVAAIEMEPRDSNFEAMVTQTSDLLNAVELDMTAKTELMQRLEEVRKYRGTRLKFLNESKLDQFANLRLPEEVGGYAARRHAAMIEEMAARVAASREALARARTLQAQGDYEGAGKEMQRFRASWRENPDAEVLKVEWLAELSRQMKKRDKTGAVQTLQLLRATWPGDPSVEDMGRTLEDRGLMAMLDNISYALVFAIGFVILLGFFALKWGLKMFAWD
jgi:hypothetical protein